MGINKNSADIYEAGETIKYRPPQCMWCDTKSEIVTLDKTSYYRWIGSGNDPGMHIQNAFPDMPPDEREILITGTHSACWDAVFGEEE